jgi:hypothetical protein
MAMPKSPDPATPLAGDVIAPIAARQRLVIGYAGGDAPPQISALRIADRHDIIACEPSGHLRPSTMARADLIVLFHPGDVIEAASQARIFMFGPYANVPVALFSAINSGLLLDQLLSDGLRAHGVAAMTPETFVAMIEAATHAQPGRPALCAGSTDVLTRSNRERTAVVTPAQIRMLLAISRAENRKSAMRELKIQKRNTLDAAASRVCATFNWRARDLRRHARGWLHATGYL